MCPAEKRSLRLPALVLAAVCAAVMAVPASAQSEDLTRRELGSNRYTQAETESEPVTGYDLEGFELLMENDTLAVYCRESVGALRIQDKRSGYVWGMTSQDKPDNLNERWAAIANSMVMVEAYDADGKLQTIGVSGERMNISASGTHADVDVELPDWKIAFTFELDLDGTGLTFSMDDATLREEGDVRLASVSFAPFLGSVEGNSVPGYIFVPDGCGALMRFLSPRNYLQGYEKRIYGADYAIDSINSSYAGEALEEQTASMPVFGITHGERQNAFLAIAQHGEEYGYIMADPAGLVCDYNRAYVKFVYRQLYEQPISRVGVGIQTIQEERNEVNPQIRYEFLTGEDAGYVGMAKTYRNMLLESGGLVRRELSESAPLRVDFLAADIQKEFVGSSVNVATSLDAVQEAQRRLLEDGVDSLEIGLLGWQKKGLNGSKKTDTSADLIYRGQDVLTALGEATPLWMLVETFSAKEGQFSARSEGGITLSQELIVKEGGDEEAYLADTWYLKPDVAVQALAGQIQSLTEKGAQNFVIGGIGEYLYGEYLSRHEMTRSGVRDLLMQTAQDLEQQLGQLTLTRPNAFLFGALGTYDQTPMVSSQFLYETDTVPFLQIVLSGSVELYAPYVNLSFFSQMDCLKMIDYNTCPTYLLTEKDNYSLRNTASADLCSTKYEDWHDHIVQTYEQVNSILDKTRGQLLEDRTVLEQGFVQNVYENGIVYVNYNASARTAADGTTVGAQSAVYVERS